jgi:hypothetical protein
MVKQLQFLHLHCLPLQLRNAWSYPKWGARAKQLSTHKEVEMRIVETAVAGVVAIATQILIVATVLL